MQRKIIMLLLLWYHVAFAITPLEEPLPTQFNWVFSGMVNDETDGHYGYYFEVKRHQDRFHVFSALIHMENKAVVFVEEDEAILKHVNHIHWQIGNAYLGLNHHTHRLVFGVKTSKKRGFKFNMDLLSNAALNHPQRLTTDLALNINQMGRLHGYLYLGKKHPEIFVTAQQVWFRQLHARTQKPHQLTNILCQFDDGSGFYAIRLPESTAVRGFLAGWQDASGKSRKISQFIKIKQARPHEWDLSVPFPFLHFHFSDLLANYTPLPISAGIVDTAQQGIGFCTAAEEETV